MGTWSERLTIRVYPLSSCSSQRLLRNLTHLLIFYGPFLFIPTTIDAWTPLPARPRTACLVPAKSPRVLCRLEWHANRRGKHFLAGRATQVPVTQIACVQAPFSSCVPSSPLASSSRSSLLLVIFQRTTSQPPLQGQERHSTILLFTMPAYSRIVSIPLRFGELAFGAVGGTHTIFEHQLMSP
jgi:hypothetical protein